MARRDGHRLCADRELDAVSVVADPGQDMEREARRAEMSGDPMAPVLRALAGMTTAMAQIAGQIEEARQPASPAGRSTGGGAGDSRRRAGCGARVQLAHHPAATGIVTVLTPARSPAAMSCAAIDR